MRVGRALWMLAAEMGTAVFVDRVPTDSNIADGPSRNDNSELTKRGAKWVAPSDPTLLSEAVESWPPRAG